MDIEEIVGTLRAALMGAEGADPTRHRIVQLLPDEIRALIAAVEGRTSSQDRLVAARSFVGRLKTK